MASGRFNVKVLSVSTSALIALLQAKGTTVTPLNDAADT